MNEQQFHLALWEAIAEDDKCVCEMQDGHPDLSAEGIDHLVKMAVCVAEPLFERIAELERIAAIHTTGDGTLAVKRVMP